MGVSSIINRVTLAGDGISTSFGFPYYFFSQADLIVYIYDTLLGGTTGPMVLNTDYTISGIPNYQGLYPSGANVVFATYVPKTTDIVIIIRSPIQEQNYSLLQSQTISSAAIVQQFDYQTLLIQRLQDEVARCIQVPDGLGEPFAGQLPSQVALSPGAFPQVNPAGNGWILSGNLMWNNVVLPYTSFNVAAFTDSVPLFVLPPGAILKGLVIKHSVAFSGPGISDVFMELGVSGNFGDFIPDFDVFQAVADQAFDNVDMGLIASFANPTQIYITANSVGAFLNALTAGSVTVWYSYETVA